MCHTCYTCLVCTFAIHATRFTYVIHITHILSIAYAVGVTSALVPEEGDDLLEEIDELRTDHLDVPVGPAEGVPHEAPYAGVLGGLVEILDPHLGALEAVTEELLFRQVQHARVLDVLLFQMVPHDPEALSFFKEVAPNLEGVDPLLTLSGSRDVHAVQEMVAHEAGDGGQPRISRRKVQEKVVELVFADFFVDRAGYLQDVIGLVVVDWLACALNGIGIKDLAALEVVVERRPFMAESGQIVLAETHKGEFVGLEVDDLDGLAEEIPEVGGKKKDEGGLPAPSLRGKERKCFHDDAIENQDNAS